MVFENSRNKSSVLGFHYEPENLVCFAKASDIPNMHNELRESITECYGYGKLTHWVEMPSAFVAVKLKTWTTLIIWYEVQ